MRSPALTEQMCYIFLFLCLYSWRTTRKLLCALHSLYRFQLQQSIDFPQHHLPHSGNGHLPGDPSLFTACLPFPSHIFDSSHSSRPLDTSVLPMEPSLTSGYERPPLIWRSLHKISKPLSKEAPAPHCHMFLISVKQSLSFEEGPKETMLI